MDAPFRRTSLAEGERVADQPGPPCFEDPFFARWVLRATGASAPMRGPSADREAAPPRRR